MANGVEARNPNQPFWAYQTQTWAGAGIENSHTEALWAFGEFAMFTMMWNVADFEAGRVGRCTVCYAGDRGAAAFEQATVVKCPGCYGTTFEGGYRAQIIRPSIVVHTTPELDTGIRGQMLVDQVSMETTTDFTLHHGDYVFRADESRYQTSEKQEDSVHEGFLVQDNQSPYVSNIAVARLEDPTSVAYLIPTLGAPASLDDVLDRSNFGVHTAHLADYIAPNGYL